MAQSLSELPPGDLRSGRCLAKRHSLDSGTSRSLLEDHPELVSAYGVTIHFCLLDDLKSRGQVRRRMDAYLGDDTDGRAM